MNTKIAALLAPARVSLLTLIRQAGSFKGCFVADYIIDVSVAAGEMTFLGAIPQEYRQFSDVDTLAFEHLARLAMDATQDAVPLMPVRKYLVELVQRAGTAIYTLEQRFRAEVDARGTINFPSRVPAHYGRCDMPLNELHFVDLVELAQLAAHHISTPSSGQRKPRWEWDRSSGYSGYRCQNCATWVYEAQMRVCSCTPVVLACCT